MDKKEKKPGKGDKKAARRRTKVAIPKIRMSKEHRGCGPRGRMLKALNNSSYVHPWKG